MKPFYERTYRGQIKALREFAANGIKQWPIKVDEIKFIQYGENTTFKFESKKKSFAMRITRPGYHTDQALNEELRFLKKLTDADFSAPRPIPGKDGKLFQKVSHPLIPEERNVILFEWQDGFFYRKRLTPSHFKLVGKKIGELHKRWGKHKFKHRKYWDAEGLIGNKPKFARFDTYEPIPKGDRDFLNKLRLDLLSELKRYQRKGDKVRGALHGDPHFGNMMFQDGDVKFIDFDDCGEGFFLYDLCIPYYYLYPILSKLSSMERENYFDHLLEGYSEYMPITELDREWVKKFVQIRELTMLGWSVSRANNPRLRDYIVKRAKENVAYMKKIKRKGFFA